MSTPLFSVVICYRNWGGERLKLAVESHLRSTLGEQVEIIVSDFGSDAERRAEKVLAGMPVRCVYTETNGPWSRSRALNAGIAAARGEYILAWDADILCTPDLHKELLAHFAVQPNSAYPLHCRDLNEHFDEARISTLLDEHGRLPIEQLRENSEWRPRWGMGIAAFRREHFDLVRGYDERMVIWGGEDRDLMNRFSRLGVAVRWVDSPAADIFHIFHGSSLDEAARTTEGQAAVTRNHDVVQRDQTVFRNLSGACYFRPRRPLVSVIVATHNRAAYLKETIPSVLNQSFPDLELIVVDDGSSDDTQDVLKRFDDPRLVVLRQENAGVAAARNAGARIARAHFILVHDDDDIMLPDRIEVQLAALKHNGGGSYGGWVDFDSESGEIVAVNSGKDFSAESIAYAGKVLLHPTVMTTRWIAQQVPYDDRYKGGSDFNWMMTIAANGANLVHTGNVHILRRLHGRSLTSGGFGQKHASRASARSSNSVLGRERLMAARTAGREAEGRHCIQEDSLDELYQFLPAGLKKEEFHFAAVADGATANAVLKAVRERADIAVTSVQPLFRAGVEVRGVYRIRGVADDPAAAKACFPAAATAYRGWLGYGPTAGRRSFPGLNADVPVARTLGFATRIAGRIPAVAWSLLDQLAAFAGVAPGEMLIGVQRERKRKVRLGSVDRLMRSVHRDTKRVGLLQAVDGVVPVYWVPPSDAAAAGLRKLAGRWSVRNLSVIAYEVGRPDHAEDSVGGIREGDAWN